MNTLKPTLESAIKGDKKEDYRYIRITDIDNTGFLKNEWMTAKTIQPQYILNDGDFLFARSGATAGKTSYFLGQGELLT